MRHFKLFSNIDLAANKEWLQLFSGVGTWLLVLYIDYQKHELSSAVFLGYLLFLVLYIPSVQIKTPSLGKQLLIIMAIVAVVTCLFSNSGITPVLLVIWASLLPEFFSKIRWIWLFIITNSTLIMLQIAFIDTELILINSMIFIGFQLFAVSSSTIRIRYRDSEGALNVTLQQLKVTQTILAQNSQLEGQLRMARDLHDGIGHKLTAISLQLEYAKHQPTLPVADFCENLKNSVTETLNELRTLVKTTRAEQHIELSHVIKQLSQELPPNVKLSCAKTICIRNPELAEQLAYCLQEGISNALRHGRATQMSIVQTTTTPITLQLIDNGIGSMYIQPSSGLRGISERLSPHNGYGTLHKNPITKGMTLTLSAEDIQ